MRAGKQEHQSSSARLEKVDAALLPRHLWLRGILRQLLGVFGWDVQAGADVHLEGLQGAAVE